MIYKLLDKFSIYSTDNQSPNVDEQTAPSTSTLSMYDEDDGGTMDKNNEATDGVPAAAPRITFVSEPDVLHAEADNNQTATVTQTTQQPQEGGNVDDDDVDDEEPQHNKQQQQQPQRAQQQPSTNTSSTDANNIDQIIRICHSIISKHSVSGLTDDELNMLFEYMPSARMHKTIHMTLFTAQKIKYLKLRAYHQRRIKQLNDEVIKSERLIEKLKGSW